MRNVEDAVADSLHLLVSVNVSLPQTIQYFQHKVTTGIYKTPVTGPAMIGDLGLEGDGQADTRVIKGRQIHGGRLKALYLYAAEHYAFWQGELGRPLPFGQFGENLTAEGIFEDLVHVGDVLEMGNAILRVTEPRFPCYKLDIKMELPEFKRRFLASGRVGFYAEVLQRGEVDAGGVIERFRGEARQESILDQVKRYRGEFPDE